MALKLSYEPAVTATVTAGIATAAAVGAALNAADMPAGWDWMETWVPVGIFLVYLLVGLVIRPLVIPTAKAKDAAKVERLVAREDVKQQFTGIRKVEPRTYTTGGYPGEHSKDPLPPPQ